MTGIADETDRLARLERDAANLTARAAATDASDADLLRAVTAQTALAEARLSKARVLTETIVTALQAPTRAAPKGAL